MNVKKIISTLTILSVIFTSSTFCFAGNSVDITQDVAHSITTDSYLKYMQDSLSSTKDATVAADLKTNISKYKSLSKDDQQKFINYISDETLMKNAINKLSNLSTSNHKSTSLESGDVFITAESIKSSSVNIKAASAATRYTITYKPKVVVLGITIFQTTNTLVYMATSSTVDSIVSFNAYVSKNYNPLMGATFKNKSTYVSDNVANAQIDIVFTWSYKIGEIITGSCRMYTRGYPGGSGVSWTEQLS
ncbi:MAG: hypothetical protein AAGU14_11040 [Eubacteriaceae bacterium]